MKTQRLYRIETPDGKGLYQRSDHYGNTVDVVPLYDTFMYTQYGELRNRHFITRDGRDSRQIEKDYLGNINVDFSVFELAGTVLKGARPSKDRPMQQKLMFEMSPEERKKILKQFGGFGFDPDQTEEPAKDERSRTRIRDYYQVEWGTRTFADVTNDAMSEKLQLEMDVDMPRRILGHKVQKGPRMTLADLLQLKCLPNEHREMWLSQSEDNRPQPSADGINLDYAQLRSGGYHFAFQSMKQITDWLDGISPADVIRSGGAIRVMDVRKAIHGKCQSVFRKRDVVNEFTIVEPGYRELFKEKVNEVV